jgi:uncharacterized membrane protein YedE/YeeE
MTEFTPLAGAIGGVMIGLSAVILMGGIGRVAGLSGIFGGMITLQWSKEQGWRALFLAGLLAGTAITAILGGIDVKAISFSGGSGIIAIGGALVGAGTALGSGCTSGHGICGISRLSARSIVSTVFYMGVAMATVFLTRHVIGG